MNALVKPILDSSEARGLRPVEKVWSVRDILVDFPFIESQQTGTATGVDGQLADWLCYRENLSRTAGLLCVSRDHRHDRAVAQYERRLEILGKDFEVVEVAIQDITALNRSAKGAASNSVEIEQAYVMQILREGARIKASDVHIQVRPDVTIVRFRVHGRVRTFWGSRTPEEGKVWLNSMYTTMCSEQSHPTLNDRDDCKANLRESFARDANLSGARLHFRPMKGYMLCVIRLNAGEDGESTIDDIGFLPDVHVPLLKYLLTHVHGVIIVSGATGHGKSKTIKTFIESYCAKRNQEVHFITGENPIEYNIRGVSVVQTPVFFDPEEENGESKAWMRFIKSSLRSDPDGIAPGELLDVHSALAAVQAAQTGHLVLTTLHVSDAIGVLQRLSGMGVPDDVLFDPSIFIGLINQSLVPVLCQDCSILLTDVMDDRGFVAPEIIDPDTLSRLQAMLPDTSTVRLRCYDPVVASACQTCGGIGELGRVPVAEICLTDSDFMETYQGRGGKRHARKHWVTKMNGFTKHMHALRLISEGKVDPATTELIIGPLDRDLRELGSHGVGVAL